MLSDVNRVVKYMVASDFVLYSGWGLISPIFSIFIIEKIDGATLFTVGIAGALYWLARGIIQPPVANMIDKIKGEADDLYGLVFALILIGLSSFALAMVTTPIALYFVQIVHGAALGIYSVTWPAIFSRHMDKNRIAFDWSLDRGSVGVAVAITSLIGAGIAQFFGFETVFIAVGVLSILSAMILFKLPKIILPANTRIRDVALSARAQRKHKSRSTTGS